MTNKQKEQIIEKMKLDLLLIKAECLIQELDRRIEINNIFFNSFEKIHTSTSKDKNKRNCIFNNLF